MATPRKQQQRQDAADASARADALDDALKGATEQGEVLRDQHLADTIADDDLAELADHALLVHRFLDDVREALKQLFVAGVAYPDPDLPQELVGLAERAERHGLATALTELLALKAELDALAAETDLFARADRSEAVWLRAQRIVTWLRLFQQELDLSAVQSRLTRQSREAGEPTPKRKPRLPVASLSCWPVGLVRRGSKLTIVAQDVDTQQQLTLVDELAEVPPQGPFAGLVISRLFRDQLNLSLLLNGLIRLEEHPFVETGSGDGRTRLFRPAFSATPTFLPVAHSFVPPPLPATPQPQGLAYRVPLTVSRTADGAVRVRAKGDSAGLYVGRILRCNLLKLLIREGLQTVELDGTLMETNDGPRLLAVTTDFDGRTFPVDDLGVFRIDRLVLARRAAHGEGGRDLAGLVLRAGAFVFGGAEADPMEAFREDLFKTRPSTLPELWLVNVLRGQFAVVPGDARAAKRAVKQAMAAFKDAVRVKRATSKGYVDSEVLFGALAALVDYGAAEEDDGTLKALAEQLVLAEGGRFTALNSPSWTDICVTALLRVLAEDPPPDDGDAQDGAEAVTSGALEFLDAYVAGLRRSFRRRGRGQQTLPDLMELLRLSYTLRVLTGADAQEPVLAGLDLPWHVILVPALETLYRWTVQWQGTVEGPAAPEVRRDAGIALLTSAHAALGAKVVTA